MDKLDFLGSKTRCRIIVCLFDGKTKYESEIARETNMSTTAISNTLLQLLEEGFVESEFHGLNMFYKLDRKKVIKQIKQLLGEK